MERSRNLHPKVLLLPSIFEVELATLLLSDTHKDAKMAGYSSIPMLYGDIQSLDQGHLASLLFRIAC